MKYAIVIEKSEDGYGAYAPDLPGVGVVGDSMEEAEQLVQEAIELYLEDQKHQGISLSLPTAICKHVEVHAP